MKNIIARPSAISDLNTTLDFILLDGSGSMNSKWWPMLEAIDNYINELHHQQVDTHIRLDVFDTVERQLTQRNCHIRDWKPFNIDPIGAYFGGTPLMDAIVLMGKNIRNLNPQHGCRILIVTDGNDGGNAVNTFANLTQARAVLDWLRAQGFQVTFMGCDFNNSHQARALGASDSNSIGVRKELLTEGMKLLASKAARHARDGSDISFTDDEKKEFGGYLTHGG